MTDAVRDDVVEDRRGGLAETIQRAAERCETVTVARVVGTASSEIGRHRELKTVIETARVVLDDDTPLTDAQRTTVGDTTTDAVLSEGNA